MLTELENARQIRGEPARRWFMSPAMDLIVWQDEESRPIGFQLCYDKGCHERALTWHEGTLTHTAISNGEDTGMKHKQAPILVADGSPDFACIAEHFAQQSAKLPAEVTELVMRVLGTHR